MAYDEGNTLRIYYSCNNYPINYIDCWCTRWDENNYDITIETFLTSGARNALYSNLRPGAVREAYKILGEPTFIDTTYSSGNTLILSPLSGYNLSGLRETRTIAVKSISDSFITNTRFGVKIEGKILSDL